MNTKGFRADIIADSINPVGNRITTYILRYPRFIHSELMTHRMFSRNAASSRAIPIEKVIAQVETDPAMPVEWGANGRGMAASGVVADAATSEAAWRHAAALSVESARTLMRTGLHKQIVNRVLEPFVWMTTLVTATEWENFFSLRVHPKAQPEFQWLSYLMLRAYVLNTPQDKNVGEWHIPFGDRMPEDLSFGDKLKVAVARAARISYNTMEGEIDVKKDIELHDKLAADGHFSCFEHVAEATNFRLSSFGNFYGWQQYRKSFYNETRTVNLKTLLKDYEGGYDA